MSIIGNNFNTTITTACELFKKFNNLDINDILNKILKPIDKSMD